MAQDLSSAQYDSSLALRSKVLSLYDVKTDSDAVINETYHHRCKFVDPLVSARGQSEVKALFRSMSTVLRNCRAELISSHYDVGSSTLTMDTNLVFSPQLWYFSHFRVRNFIVVVVDRHGMVKSHTDHWSIASLVETKLGWLYNVARRAVGILTSVVVNWVLKDRSKPLLRDSQVGAQLATGGVKAD